MCEFNIRKPYLLHPIDLHPSRIRHCHRQPSFLEAKVRNPCAYSVQRILRGTRPCTEVPSPVPRPSYALIADRERIDKVIGNAVSLFKDVPLCNIFFVASFIGMNRPPVTMTTIGPALSTFKLDLVNRVTEGKFRLREIVQM